MRKLLDGIIVDPDSRRHDLNLWQIDDFNETYGLMPCAYNSHFTVRHGRDGIKYLDMSLKQRSSDFITAGCINQVQYLIFLYLVARHTEYTPGRFTWWVDNMHIYDRHIDFAKEMLEREPISCEPTIWLNPDKKDFYDFTQDNIKAKGYSLKLVQQKNPNPNPRLPIAI